jgi:hypothetical protein
MSPYTDELVRLQAANPAPVEPDRSQTPTATATLARILREQIDGTIEARSDGRSRARRLGRWIAVRSSRRLILVLAAALTVGGGAFAATDPLGWWSTNPTYAKYGSNPPVHVRTPTAREITCARSGGVLRCSPASYELPSGHANGRRSTAQMYTPIDAIRPPVHGVTRATLLTYIARRRAAGTMSAAQAARLRADIAAVPDSFFTEFELASRYGTYGDGGETRNGLTLFPPAGIPSLVVCEPAGRGLSCQDLNGDEHTPIGAGVYAAIPARNWRYKRVPPENWNLPPGFSFTRAEERVLIDMGRFATVTHTSSTATKATLTPPRRLTHRPGG